MEHYFIVQVDVLCASALESVMVQQDSGIAIGDLPGLLKHHRKLVLDCQSPLSTLLVLSLYI